MGCQPPQEGCGDQPGRTAVDPDQCPDRAPVYVILGNLSAHKGDKIRGWAKKNRVELCFTPTYASWANPVEAPFGPLAIANSHHRNHSVQTRALHAYLHWRNANARHPGVLAAERK